MRMAHPSPVAGTAAIAPETDWAFLRMAARAKLRAGDPAAALPFAELALKIYPRDSETKRVLGVALARTGPAARGEKLLTEVSTLEAAKFHGGLGGGASARPEGGCGGSARPPRRRPLLEAKQWTNAAAAYENVVQLATNDATSWNNLGFALLQLNRPRDAIAPLERAVMINPHRCSAWLNLPQAARLSSRTAGAKVAEQKARGLPKDPNEINFK